MYHAFILFFYKLNIREQIKVGTNFVKREPNLTEESKTNPSDVPEFEDMETQEKYAVRASYTFWMFYCSLKIY